MKKIWIKKIVAVIVFIISVFIIDKVINRENADITAEMAKATLPVISIEVEDYIVNTMYGYTSRRQEAFTKGELTPITGERILTLMIDTFQTKVESIDYEVRSMNGQRLIEGSEITDFEKEGNLIHFSIQLKDLIEADMEYSFITILTLEGGEEVFYYTRFIQNDNYHTKEKLDFVLDFHNVTFSDSDGQEIKKYLESGSKGDNSSFHSVNIYSSLKQVMWDELPIQKVQEPNILIKDISTQTAGIVLQYLVQEKGSRNENYYFVEEYYRIRYTASRMYLLDYERTMEEIFDADSSSFKGNMIRLGIVSKEDSIEESESGAYLAFINGNRLFLYNTVDNQLSQVFSFYDRLNFDIRSRNRDFEIKILDLEENGSLTFMIAGYMNRGIHEGRVGIVIYYYNRMMNTIEEQIFIPYEKSTDILIQELKNISYLNKENHIFLILNNTLYDVNLNERIQKTVVSGITENTYKVSLSQRMMVWLKENEPFASDTLVWLDLDNGQKIETSAELGEKITALGFIGEDLVYGLAKEEDINTDALGNTLFPMYKILIKNQEGSILKTYQKENCYVTDSKITNNLITLNRVQRIGEHAYKAIEDDHIASNDIEKGGVNQVVTATENIYKSIVRIEMKSVADESLLKVLTPKEVMFEGARELELEQKNALECYYVYGSYGVEYITNSSAEAIALAYQLSGSVVDENGKYIWKKGTVHTRNQIMAIKEERISQEKSSLAVCLDTILQFEGISFLTQSLLDIGEDAFSILGSTLRQKKMLDLEGCILDSILYYVDQDIPVLALLNSGEAVLIIGFNEQNVVIMDPKTGTIAKKGMNDSRTMFAQNGNRFITYIPVE